MPRKPPSVAERLTEAQTGLIRLKEGLERLLPESDRVTLIGLWRDVASNIDGAVETLDQQLQEIAELLHGPGIGKMTRPR